LPRQDVASRNHKKTQKRYLLSKQTATEVAKSTGVSARTFARRKKVSYQAHSTPPVITGEIYPWLAIDAMGLNIEVVAIVRDAKFVRNWRFARYESSQVWEETLYELPRPAAIVCDGQKGILKALFNLWGNSLIIQRCHFHVKQNMRAKLTNNPESAAGQDLKRLMGRLSYVRTEDQMSYFIAIFYELYEVYGSFIRERTYSPNAKRKWFYTHRGVRSAYRQIANLIEQDQLFAYITHPELGLPRTTNVVEGGINSRLSELIRAHRGMLPAHQRRLVTEYLQSRTEQCQGWLA